MYVVTDFPVFLRGLVLTKMEGEGLRKSDGDLKDYRVVTLSGSNLECLLVSSVNTSKDGDNVKAAAAMSVQVGSFADPAVAGM